MRIKTNSDGTTDITGEGSVEYVASLADPLIDATLLDYSSEREPSTPADCRRKLASIEAATKPPAGELRAFILNAKDGLGESRAQTTVTTGGGYICQQPFLNIFGPALKQADQIFDVATRVLTDVGGPFNLPIDDDTATNAAIVSENSLSATNADVVFGALALPKVPQWRTGLIRCSHELLQDSAFPFDEVLAGLFAKRFARGVGSNFVTALLAAADVAVTSAVATAVTVDELLSLLGSLDAAAAQVGTFMMSFSSYIKFLQQKGSTGGSYLIPATTDAAGYPTLFGRRVYLSPNMPAIAANAKSISFGDHSKFIRREVRGSLMLKTYVERYAEIGQSAFEGFWRIQGDLAKGAVSPMPVRVLQCHA